MVEYFIDIINQNKFRTEILTAKRTLLECLKRCELFKQVIEQKLDEIEDLRNTLKEIIKLYSQLKQQMPKVKVKLGEKEYSRSKKASTLYDYNKELKKLESSITHIESKLKEFEK